VLETGADGGQGGLLFGRVLARMSVCVQHSVRGLR
jgi:hypothetical protein